MNSNSNYSNKSNSINSSRKKEKNNLGKNKSQANELQIKLEIQLDDENVAILVIKEEDDPKKTVDKFCKENDLDDEIKEHILNEVNNKIEENLRECN